MLENFFKEEINVIFGAYENAVGSGLYIGIFLLALLYIFINVKEEKLVKTFLGVYSVLVMFCIWNPLFSKFLVKFIGDDVYWRVYWLLPIGIVLAYVFTKMIFMISDKIKKLIAFLAICIIIFMSGKCIYSDEFFKKVNNYYKIPDDVLEIISIISEDDENYKKLAGPEEFIIYTRQIDGKIIVECPRSIYGIYSDDSLIMKISNGQVREAAKLAKERKCNYVVIPNNIELTGRMETYGYNEFANNEVYTLYKLNTK